VFDHRLKENTAFITLDIYLGKTYGCLLSVVKLVVMIILAGFGRGVKDFLINPV